MSQLIVDTIRSNGSVVRVEKPNVLNIPGHIVDTTFNVAMQQFYYKIPSNNDSMRGSHVAEGAYGPGMIIRPLDITVTPKTPNNWFHIEWNVHFEAHHDVVFNAARDGQYIGGQLYGGDQNQSRWNGLGVSRYDNNNDSTPSYINMSIMDRPGTISPTTYSFCVRTSDNAQREMVLNCTLGSYENGTDNHEIGVSFAIAQEIADNAD
jgi:hypothetical protein